jgi:hypothetical protein
MVTRAHHHPDFIVHHRHLCKSFSRYKWACGHAFPVVGSAARKPEGKTLNKGFAHDACGARLGRWTINLLQALKGGSATTRRCRETPRLLSCPISRRCAYTGIDLENPFCFAGQVSTSTSREERTRDNRRARVQHRPHKFTAPHPSPRAPAGTQYPTPSRRERAAATSRCR